MAEITTKADGRVVVVRISGEVDVGPAGVDSLRTVVEGIIDSSGEGSDHDPKIALDLSKTTYVVSRGFGQILVALARCRTRDGDLVVFGCQGQVWATASAVGLDHIIKFFPDETSAIARFNEYDSEDDDDA